jgi:Flp pilus assembly protein TadG
VAIWRDRDGQTLAPLGPARAGEELRVKIFKNDCGQVIVFAAMGMGLLIGFLALGTDVGLLLHQKRVMQTAADSAALAAAAELPYGDAASAARTDALQNGIPNSAVTVNTPPKNGPHAGVSATDNKYVEVILTQSQPTFFMHVFNRDSMNIATRAVGTIIPTTSCMYALQSSPPSGMGVSLAGNVQATLTNCGIIDDATGGSALSVSGAQASLSASSIRVVGGVSSSGTISPSAVTGAAAVGDPLSNISPPAWTTSSCGAQPSGNTFGPASSGGTVCYNGINIGGTGTYTFQPGTYIINGNFTVSSQATLNGTGGVTFYIPSGTVNVSGGATLNLTAPSTGAETGMLFYQNPSDTNSMTFAGNTKGTLSGIFYAPNAQLNFGGTSGATFDTDIVVGSISISGTPNISAYIPLAGSPLSTARLVE